MSPNIKTGMTLVPIRDTFEDANGVKIDVSAATVIQIILKQPNGITTETLTAAAVVGVTGEHLASWPLVPVGTSGVWRRESRAVVDGAEIWTEPVSFRVDNRLIDP